MGSAQEDRAPLRPELGTNTALPLHALAVLPLTLPASAEYSFPPVFGAAAQGGHAATLAATCSVVPSAMGSTGSTPAVLPAGQIAQAISGGALVPPRLLKRESQS